MNELQHMDKVISESQLNNTMFSKADVISILISHQFQKSSAYDLARFFSTIPDCDCLHQIVIANKSEKQLSFHCSSEKSQGE